MLPGLAGVAGVAALFSAVQDFSERAAKLRNMNRQTGISIDMLQRMGFVAKQTGLQMEDLTKIWLRMAELQERARRGQQETLKNLSAVGIFPDVFARASREEGFRMLAEAARTPNLGALRVLMPELGPRLRQAAQQNIPGLLEQAPVRPAAEIERAAQIGDELKTIRESLANDMAPTLFAILEAVRYIASGIEAFRSGSELAGGASGLVRKIPGGWMTAATAAIGNPYSQRDVQRTIQKEFSDYVVFYLQQLVRQSTRSADALTQE